VPKITVITRKAYGGAYDVMSSKHIGADVNFAYPTAEVAVMGPDGAVNILYKKENLSDEEKKKRVEEYKQRFASPYKAAELGYIDEIIFPKETRFKLIQSLEMTQTKSRSNPPKKHGNIPL
jgi:propionyl-CoA carboxylase beta chain